MVKCLVEHCKMEAAEALKRGLCMRCHAAANQAIKRGDTTWDEQETIGLALPNGPSNFDNELKS